MRTVLTVITVIAFGLVLNLNSALAEKVILDYHELYGWKIYSAHEQGTSLASSCNISGKFKPLFISYSAQAGWTVSFKIKDKAARLPKKGNGVVWVDNSVVGSHPYFYSSKYVHFNFVLNTKFLHPIFKSKKIKFGMRGKNFEFVTKGIHEAYGKALGCWRERMKSAGYVPDKQKAERKQQRAKRKNQNSEKSLTVLEGFKEILDWQGTNVEIDKNGIASLSTVNDKGKKITFGAANTWQTDGKRLSFKQIAKDIKSVTSQYSDCDKFALQKIKPYFTKNNVEVHGRKGLCKSGSFSEEFYVWHLQSENDAVLIYIAVPTKLAETFAESEKSGIEFAASLMH